jgi:hypothetical protein
MAGRYRPKRGRVTRAANGKAHPGPPRLDIDESGFGVVMRRLKPVLGGLALHG